MSTKLAALLLCVLILFSGCGKQASAESRAPSAVISEADGDGLMKVEWPDDPVLPEAAPAAESTSLTGENASGPLFPNAIPLENSYIQTVADGILADIITPEMSDIERLRAAYEWMISRTYFAEPVGLDIWRYRGNARTTTPFVENRALSVLLFGLGECEDYACAMTVLARRMGYESEYVFGMTVSVHREWVDHAWCVVRVGGLWYHLDPQLEDNVMRDGKIENRYFMRDDSAMSSDHLWGAGLVAARGGLSAQQRETILTELTPPACLGNVAPAPPAALAQTAKPDRAAEEASLSAERAAYTAKNGALPPMELNIEPPMEIYDPEVY